MAQIAAILFVITLALIAYFVFIRMRCVKEIAGIDRLKQVYALPLGPRERLVLVDWGEQRFLLAITAGGITLVSQTLTAMDNASEVSRTSVADERNGIASPQDLPTDRPKTALSSRDVVEPLRKLLFASRSP